jgi:hypothetical protein
MQKKALEITCYVAGAGAFGVFLRWLENQLAFEEGLAEPSAFHWMLAAFLIACALVFRTFLWGMDQNGAYVPPAPHDALGSPILLHRILAIASGAVMAIGALLLFAKSETDPFVGMLRTLSALALLSGVAYPLAMAEMEKEEPRPALLCVLMLLPMLTYAVWLVLSYRENAINSVPLAFGLDMLVAILNMVAYFRLAGFAFGAPKPWRALLAAMLSATVSLMSLADGRHLGMEIMLLATAGQMLLSTWILVQNLREKERKVIVKRDDGFEHLDDSRTFVRGGDPREDREEPNKSV